MTSDAWTPVADWHTHTVYSDGSGTVLDNARAALKKGLESLAITDHGPASLTAGVWRAETLLQMVREAERARDEVQIEILAGVEANVVGVNGDIDVPVRIYSRLDVLAVGLHRSAAGAPPSARPGSWWRRNSEARRRARAANTAALTQCLRTHPVDVVTHPGLGVDIDTAELARAAERSGTALEINARHALSSIGFLRVAARFDVRFWCSSDAHAPEDVGELRAAIEVAREVGIDPARIANVRAGTEHPGYV